jgi:AcrR family transcriptional regulator
MGKTGLSALWSEKKLLARPFVWYKTRTMRGTSASRPESESEKEILETLERAILSEEPVAVDGRRARGEKTRDAILARAVQIASEEGLEGLSIGRLAGDLGVSKSGLFAHFGSKIELQLATVDAARHIFIHEVIGGSRAGSGIGGLIGLTDSWLDYMRGDVFHGGCFFAAASLEFDGRPGPVRDRVASMMGEWLLALDAAIQDAQATGELAADIDSEQLAFEINALGQGANWAYQLYGDEAAFERARAAIHRAVSEKQRLPVLPDVDEGAARRTLREQIAKLERELASLFVSAYPRGELDWQVSSPGGPRLLDVGDLESLRDQLAERVEGARRELATRAESHAEGRERIEALVADPGSHKWERVSNEDVGEPGCKYWHSSPRLGLIGMLMGWWRVKISSGCP